MCGINGIWRLDGGPIDVTALEWATTRLRHRGPDDEGYLLADPQDGDVAPDAEAPFTARVRLCGGRDTTPALNLPPLQAYQAEKYSLGLGFRRLAILDLSPSGHQPMSSSDGRLWMVFNGEIYNYLELRQELAGLGFTFHTGTDSEVILAAYQAWGANCLQRFNGMWGMAIWDIQERSLFLSRDRFGVKPLYYVYEQNTFAFASEIKALVGSNGLKFNPEPQSIYHYLSRGRLPGGRSEATFFAGVHSLPPGYAIQVDRSGVKVYRYWNLETQAESEPQPFELLVEEYRALFEDAVSLRLRSDVAVGTCLSGGIDSSAIVCVINRLMAQKGFTNEQIGQQQRTFSAVYEMQGPFNERAFVDKVLNALVASGAPAQGNFTWPNVERLRDEAERMIWHQDEPFQSTSIFAQWCVMSKVRERGVTVLLDGQGADEILGGYRPFRKYLGDLLRANQYAAAWREARAIGVNTDVNGWRYFIPALGYRLSGWISHMERGWQSDLNALAPGFKAAGKKWHDRLVDQARPTLDRHLRDQLEDSSLPHLLRYEDRNSMAFSIEARVPFLDYRFVGYNFGPAAAWRIRDGWTKYVLRRAIQPWVPEEIVWRKDKVGFATPEKHWLRQWLEMDRAWLFEPWLSQDYLSKEVVKGRIEEWIQNGGRMPPVWRWVNLELWLRAWQQA
jgi:asparagine synthase (glutamine-hydrolysing)